MADLSNKLYTHFHTPRSRIDAALALADVTLLDLLAFADAEGFSPDATLTLVEQGCTPKLVRETQAAIRECRRKVFAESASEAVAAELALVTLEGAIRPYYALRRSYADARASAKFMNRWN